MSLQSDRLVLADGKLWIRPEFSPEPWPIAGAGPKERISLGSITQACEGRLAPAITVVKDPSRTDIINAAFKVQASNGTLVYRITEWDQDAMCYTLEWPD